MGTYLKLCMADAKGLVQGFGNGQVFHSTKAYTCFSDRDHFTLEPQKRVLNENVTTAWKH